MNELSEWRECEERACVCVCVCVCVFVSPTCIPLRHIITFSSLAVFVLNNESFVPSDASTCSLSAQLSSTHIKLEEKQTRL